MKLVPGTHNIFLGDSFTAGTNVGNQCSFPHLVSNENVAIHNYGVDGTTIGDYSIYPVHDYLCNLMRYRIAWPNNLTNGKIFLEYGLNDVSAIMSGKTNLHAVISDLVSALDDIRQYTPNIELYFLYIPEDMIDYFAVSQCCYLENVYFKGLGYKYTPANYADIYNVMMNKISNILPMIPMITKGFDFDTMIDSDELHPNYAGHLHIASNIAKFE